MERSGSLEKNEMGTCFGDRGWLRALQGQEDQEAVGGFVAEEETNLQPWGDLQEICKELEKWIPAMEAERAALLDLDLAAENAGAWRVPTIRVLGQLQRMLEDEVRAMVAA